MPCLSASVQWQLSVCFLPCLTVKFIKQTKSTTFLLHLKICFHHHVLVWPNSNMLSSFCQRLCKSTWGGVLILLPKGFIKYTFYQITFYNRTCCCQDLFSNETWNNIDATATLFKTILMSLMFSHFWIIFKNNISSSSTFAAMTLSSTFPFHSDIFQCTALSDTVKLSFWPPYNVFPC